MTVSLIVFKQSAATNYATHTHLPMGITEYSECDLLQRSRPTVTDRKDKNITEQPECITLTEMLKLTPGKNDSEASAV